MGMILRITQLRTWNPGLRHLTHATNSITPGSTVERCLSGRKSLIRNQVYSLPVPWVRIPPSPPNQRKAAHNISGVFKITTPIGINAAGESDRGTRSFQPNHCIRLPSRLRLDSYIFFIPSLAIMIDCCNAINGISNILNNNVPND